MSTLLDHPSATPSVTPPRPPSGPLPTAPEGAVLVRSAKSPDAPSVRLAKSVNADPSQTPTKAQENRAGLFFRQRVAASILTKQRVAHCHWSMADLSTQVAVKRRAGFARFEGLQTCGSVWHCPFCSARISDVRRVELNKALIRARALGLPVVMITLTARHQSGDDLPALLEALKKAKNHWHDSRTYKRHKPTIAGCITATELTHGANGWHPHFHILVFLRGTLDLGAFRDDLAAQWVASLEARGLSGNDRAFELQDASAAGQYVAKWGAAEEMTLSAKKGGEDAKSKGRHPFDFLRTAAVNPRDRALFFTYAIAFKGRRQLVWSKGLRDLLAVPETTDEQAAVIEPDEAEDEFIVAMTKPEWTFARRKGRDPILRACEDTTMPLQDALDRVENGPDQEA